MHKAQEMVRQFHREVLNAPAPPAVPEITRGPFRASLILEEALETVVALVGTDKAADMLHEALCNMMETERSEPNLVEAVDGFMDVLVVTYGGCEEVGIDAEPYFDEVMRTNMAKVDGPVRADGKRLKPPGWTPPDIAGLLARQVSP